MFFLSLILTIRCAYAEFTSSDFNTTIGGPAPIFVKFYRKTCGFCRAMALDFQEASNALPNLTFAGVECSEQPDICNSFPFTSVPTLMLFLAGDRTPIEYSGSRTSESFCAFIENYTDFRAIRPPKVIRELNVLNFGNFSNDTECGVVTFFTPDCPHCRDFLPEFKIAAWAFVPDSQKVSFATVNCPEYGDVCDERKIRGVPTIRLYRRGEEVEYGGDRNAVELSAFLNEQCGTERGADGLLNDTAGLIEEASNISHEFIASDQKVELLERLRNVGGAEFYVKIAERYIGKGVEQVEKDRELMRGMLDGRKGSFTALDVLKKRFNIVNEFFPKPSPTPSPEPSVTAGDAAEESL